MVTICGVVSQVVTTMSSILALGCFTSSRATFPTYMVFASLAIYPAALALVYFLDYVVGQFCPPIL